MAKVRGSHHPGDVAGLGSADRRGSALDARLLTTAAGLFSVQGYAAVSVDQIASAAGAGKQSIYRRFPTKEALFKAAVTACYIDPLTAAWDAQLGEAGGDARGGGAPLEVLRTLCRRVLDFVRRPEVFRLYRIIVAEGWRFPEWSAAVSYAGSGWERAILEQLRQARRAGHLPDVHVENAHRVLAGMVTGWVLRQGLAGAPPPDDEECDRFFDCAWAIFLHGLRPRDAEREQEPD